MRHKRIKGFGCLLVLLLAIFARESYAEVAVVVNSQVPATQLSTSELRQIFTARQSNWSDGTPVTVFVMPDMVNLHQVFCKQKLKLFPYQLSRIWNKLVYSGLSERPQVVLSVEQMRDAVMNTPGAIGYMPASDLGTLKVLQVEE